MRVFNCIGIIWLGLMTNLVFAGKKIPTVQAQETSEKEKAAVVEIILDEKGKVISQKLISSREKVRKKEKTKKKEKEKNKPQRTLLQGAYSGDLDRVKQLVNSGFDINKKRGKHLRTPLHEAARGGRIELMEFLLTKKANIDRHDGAGNTALILAVKEGNFKAVELLDNENADTKTHNFLGHDAVHYAVKGNYEKIVELIQDDPFDTDSEDED